MKKIITTLIGMSLIGVAASSYAEYRPYADIGFGYSALEDMPDAGTYNDLPGVLAAGKGTSTMDNIGGRVAIGLMWDIETKLSYGLEAAGAYYGVAKYSNDSSSVDMNYYGIELLGVAQLNFDKIHLIGKAGATDEQLHPTKTNLPNISLDDSNQVLPEVGAGIAYSVTTNLQVGLSYYHTFGNSVSFESNGDAENLPTVDMALLEFQYML